MGFWAAATPSLISLGASYLGGKEKSKSADHAAQAADPFASQRGYYQDRLRSLYEDPGRITDTPGYQFTLQQGLQGTERAASAQGLMGSGNLLASLTEYAAGLASQTWGQEIDRLSTLSGATTGSPGAAAEATMAGGAAKASWYTDVGKASGSLWDIYQETR
jgi:hypothetical protein